MQIQSKRPRIVTAGRRSPKYHGVITLLTCLLLIALTACMITYLDWRETQYEQHLTAEQAKLTATIQKAREARFATARKAEADAKSVSAGVLARMQSTATPQTSTADCAVSNSLPVTIVVNKRHCLNPISYTPQDLVTVDGHQMRSDAAQAMTTMQADASAARAPFAIFSSYRSYDDQVLTYNSIVAANGTAAADTLSARPGYSEHQAGLAADLEVGASCTLDCFETTPAYAWLTQHAADYGFIQRYPKDLTPITGYDTEAWHWRYVGKHTALDMRAKGLQTLEEYFNISGGNYN